MTDRRRAILMGLMACFVGAAQHLSIQQVAQPTLFLMDMIDPEGHEGESILFEIRYRGRVVKISAQEVMDVLGSVPQSK